MNRTHNTSRTASTAGRPHAPGFTLMELLVAMVIIIILVGLTFPFLNAMRGSRLVAGTNSVSAAFNAARQFAGRDIQFLKDLDTATPGDQTSEDLGDGYSGSGILFTPGNEARLIENDQFASRTGALNASDSLELNGLNGYKDIGGRDAITVPRGVGVVGLTRGGTGFAGLRLYAPPFAVRFDEHGHLISAQTSSADRIVYYDSNYDGSYDTGSSRQSTWDPAGYDPEQTTNAPFNNTVNKFLVANFEEIHTVVGIVVFDKESFYDEGFNMVSSGTAQSINTAARDWILANGRVFFVNRYTGTIMRTDGQ